MKWASVHPPGIRGTVGPCGQQGAQDQAVPERPQPSGGGALEWTPAGLGTEGIWGGSAPMCWALSISMSPQTWLWLVLGGRSGPGSVPEAPAPPDPGPQATPSPSCPHGATGTRGVGGPDLGRPETASHSMPGPGGRVRWGQWGVVSTKGATALSPVPLAGLGGCTGVPSRTGGKQPCPLVGPGLGPGVEVSAGPPRVVHEPLSPHGHCPPQIFFTRQACDLVRFYQMIRSSVGEMRAVLTWL